MKTNPTNETKFKSPEDMTDADICGSIGKLTGGYRGHWATYEIPSDNASCYLTVFHSEGWTDARGDVHENSPDFLHSRDPLVPVIERLSFETQFALHQRVGLCTPPREVCLEILRELGHFKP